MKSVERGGVLEEYGEPPFNFIQKLMTRGKKRECKRRQLCCKSRAEEAALLEEQGKSK